MSYSLDYSLLWYSRCLTESQKKMIFKVLQESTFFFEDTMSPPYEFIFK